MGSSNTSRNNTQQQPQRLVLFKTKTILRFQSSPRGYHAQRDLYLPRSIRCKLSRVEANATIPRNCLIAFVCLSYPRSGSHNLRCCHRPCLQPAVCSTCICPPCHRSPWLQTTISHRPTALSPFRHATPVHHIAFKPHAFATTVSPSFTCSAPEYAPSPSLCPLAVLCAVALTPCA